MDRVVPTEEDELTQVGGGSLQRGNLETIFPCEAEQRSEPVCFCGLCVLLTNLPVLDTSGAELSIRELIAPVCANLRRSAALVDKRIRFGDVEIDMEHRYIRRCGQTLKLTPNEYNLLLFLIKNVDQALTRNVILNQVWGYDCYPNTRTVDTHVVKLRRKLEPNPRVPRYLLTVHGVGYRFVMIPANSSPPEDTSRSLQARVHSQTCATQAS